MTTMEAQLTVSVQAGSHRLSEFLLFPTTDNTLSPLPIFVDLVWGSLHGSKSPGRGREIQSLVWSLSCDRSHTQGLSPSTYKPLLLDSTKTLLYSLSLKLHISKDLVACSGWMLEVQLKTQIGCRSKWTQLPSTVLPSSVLLQ